MKTNRQVQEFKAENRKALARKRAKRHALTLAKSNLLRNQPLDVSRVEISEQEIELDD
jgi:hypothetical protein